MNPAEQIYASEISMLTGTVLAVKPRAVVRTEQSIVHGIRATSCLIEPEVGDLVMLARTSDRQVFILAVLQRDERSALVLSAKRDIVIESLSGGVKLRGQEQVEVSSTRALDVAAPELSFNTLRANVNAAEARFTGKSILATVESLKVVASSIESLAESVIQQFARLIRQVSGSEQEVARNLQYRGQESCSLHGKNALLTAEQLVRIDSEQIHIG